MHGYLRLVIDLRYPISHIKSPILRQFSRHEHVFSFDYFNDVLLKLVEIVEDRIKDK